MGAMDSQKNPVQEVRAGGRPDSPARNSLSGPSMSSSQHAQETGVYQEQSVRQEHQPPPYEPGQSH